MTTQEKNIIIALFLGFQKTPLGYYDAEEILNVDGSNTFFGHELKFHLEREWLEPVIKSLLEVFKSGEMETTQEVVVKYTQRLKNISYDNLDEAFQLASEIINIF